MVLYVVVVLAGSSLDPVCLSNGNTACMDSKQD